MWEKEWEHEWEQEQEQKREIGPKTKNPGTKVLAGAGAEAGSDVGAWAESGLTS